MVGYIIIGWYELRGRLKTEFSRIGFVCVLPTCSRHGNADVFSHPDKQRIQKIAVQHLRLALRVACNWKTWVAQPMVKV